MRDIRLTRADGKRSVGFAHFLIMLVAVMLLSALGAKATWLAWEAKTTAGIDMISSCGRQGSEDDECAAQNESSISTPRISAGSASPPPQQAVRPNRITAAPLQPDSRSTTPKQTSSTLSSKGAKVDTRRTAAAQDLSETSLPLLLKGTVIAGHMTGNLAIIAERGGGERLYKTGDVVPGGATLSEIHPEMAILSGSNGLREVLPLYGGSWVGSRSAPHDEEIGVEDEKNRSRKDRLAAFRAEIIAEPTRFSERVNYQPLVRDGKIAGFVISPRGKDEFLLFRSVGLQPGDLITHINGQFLGHVAALPALGLKLAGATEVSLDVERNGRTETVVMSFD